MPGALVFVAHIAAANSLYPGVIHETLDLPPGELYPPCTICHDSLAGGFGTVNKDFGKGCRARGLTATNGQDELPGILDAMEKDGVDSDDDGVLDVEELRDGTDPNDPDNTLSPPRYGCLSTASGTTPALVLALAALGRARRRSR